MGVLWTLLAVAGGALQAVQRTRCTIRRRKGGYSLMVWGTALLALASLSEGMEEGDADDGMAVAGVTMVGSILGVLKESWRDGEGAVQDLIAKVRGASEVREGEGGKDAETDDHVCWEKEVGDWEEVFNGLEQEGTDGGGDQPDGFVD